MPVNPSPFHHQPLVKERVHRVMKRQNASTENSSHTWKACKLSPDNTLPPIPLCVGESAKDIVVELLYRMPATKRIASHSSLIESEYIVYAIDIETQIAAEAHRVIRKDIP